MNCKKCGSDLPKDVKFCQTCGYPVSNWQRFKKIYILIIALIVVAIGASYLSSQSDDYISDDQYSARPARELSEYADTFEAQYNGIMEEVDDYESGNIDAEELARQFRGYSDGVKLNINNMLEDIPENDARNYLETTAWNLYYFADHCADYIANGDYSELEDGLKEAENFIERIENFKNTYLD